MKQTVQPYHIASKICHIFHFVLKYFSTCECPYLSHDVNIN